MIPVGFGGASGGYSVTNSVRANGTSGYLSRTPGSAATNRKVWTFATWVKKCGTATYQYVLSSNRGGTTDSIAITNSETIRFFTNDGIDSDLISNAVLRDYSGWFHLCVVVDTTQAVAADRVKLYLNGVQITSFGTSTYPSQNYDTYINHTVSHSICRYANGGSASLSAYLADTHIIDGQALMPTDFGQADANGVWVPIAYAGTFGTNGFKLEFQSSGNLGDDTSGNNNDWTVTGFVASDQMIDTPTNNYCTWNAIRPSTSTLSSGNLTAAGTASGTIPASQSDKWYWEVTANAVSVVAGVENTSGTTYTQSVTNGTTTGFRYTHSSTTLEYTTNGSTWNTVSAAVSGVAFPYATGASNTVNFGATAFAYTPPTGFLPITAAHGASTAVTTSGTFTGNANADGPFVWTDGNPATLTINGNAVTFGTHADKTAGGFKLRTSSASYNTSGSNTWTATAGKRFVYSATSINTAQGNP